MRSGSWCKIPELVFPSMRGLGLFEPFFTTKDVGSGSGLGLYICHKYLSQYGGSIELVDRPEYATSFLIRFPHTQAAELSHDEPCDDVPTTSERASRRRLLLIDDDGMIRTELQHALAPRFDTIVTAGSGREAIGVLKSQSEFDLILCDVLMPDGSGPDVHRWLSLHRPEMLSRVGFITGGAYTDDARAFLAEHQPACLEKPFAREDLDQFLDALVTSAEVGIARS